MKNEWIDRRMDVWMDGMILKAIRLKFISTYFHTNDSLSIENTPADETGATVTTWPRQRFCIMYCAGWIIQKNWRYIATLVNKTGKYGWNEWHLPKSSHTCSLDFIFLRKTNMICFKMALLKNIMNGDVRRVINSVI